MRRTIISLAGIAAILSVPGPALAYQSSTVDKWLVGYDSSNDICFMQTNSTEANGTSSSVRIEIDYDGGRLLKISNSGWTMASSDTSVEIWFDRNWERTADVVKTGRWHNSNGATHLDIAFDTVGIDRLKNTDWMIVRTSTNGHFKNYNLGRSSAAVNALWDCDAEWDDDWW